ncbi:MAG: eukaryotic-like serine/threonine-protein kinase [Acidobacteriota bacterium]|jgi:Tol biopolymer transport system component|nr:eukaryotic-like serine/threonine-protein kinase [Acidobacteriota bacterium]
MGEVWKGRDTRLDRSVAIKLLPAEFAQNAELKARLEREAKTVSQLNHPHICTLYDFGVEGDTSYLVMELVEGETLADRLDRGPLPLAEVLRYGAQIADALDRAHRAHIVHRDLKPGNVMITRTGVKLLDFGLAKAAPMRAQHDNTTVVNQRPLTAEGSVVGTLQYMSPEQLSGDAVDHRTDIFALGAVLYELATGRRAFIGSTNTSLIAAILSSDPPPMSELQPLTPASFEHIVAKCLAKDPEGRWQSAHDIAEELRWVAQQPSGSMKTAVAPAPKRIRSALPWLIAAAAIAIASIASWRAHSVAAPQVTKTILSAAIENAWNTAPVFSPDGRRVAYPAEGALWIRALDELEPRKVPLISVRPMLFWSPDGKWLAYVDEDKLWKIAQGGNAPVLIAPLPRSSRFFHAGAWGADDRIILAQYKGGLFEISARGGSATEFLPADPELVDFHNLSFLPDGKRLLAVPHKLTNMATVEVIDGTKRKTVIDFGQSIVRGVSYSSATGHILVSLGGLNAGVWAVPFSAETGAPTGKQFLVAAGAGACSASADGSLVYVANVDDAPRQLVRIDRTGKIVARIGEPTATAGSPVLSPDEKTIAYSSHEGNFESIGLFDIATGTRRRLTSPVATDSPRAWSHDGHYLLADRSPSVDWNDQAFGIWLVPVDGSGEPTKIAKGAPNNSWGNFTPDDRNIVFLTFAVRDAANIATVPVTGGVPREIVKSPFPKTDLTISPDGHFIAYTTRESGTDEVVATRYPEGQGRWPVSRGPGSRPVWSRDGHTIYFIAANKLFSAPVSYAPPSMAIGEPVVVFDAAPAGLSLNNVRYDVFRDGSIITTQDLPPPKRQVVLVQNWLEEFR